MSDVTAEVGGRFTMAMMETGRGASGTSTC